MNGQRMTRAGAWLSRQANRAIAASLFWLFSIAAIALLGIGLIGYAIIEWPVSGSAAGILGAIVANLGTAARDVIATIRQLLGGRAAPSNAHDGNQE